MRAIVSRDEAERISTGPAVKLHPDLTGTAVNAMVKNGKVEIRVWLNDVSAAALGELKKLGFELTLQPKTAKVVIGRIAADKLKALSELQVVRYVGPVQ